MSTYLMHHGIKGQRWGVRRFQNEDGSLTEAGRRRAEKAERKQLYKEYKRDYNSAKSRHYAQARRDLGVDAKEVEVYKTKERFGIKNSRIDESDDVVSTYGKLTLRDREREYDELDKQAMDRAKALTHDELMKKYGEDTLRDLESMKESRDAVATGAAIAASIVGTIGFMVLVNKTDR